MKDGEVTETRVAGSAAVAHGASVARGWRRSEPAKTNAKARVPIEPPTSRPIMRTRSSLLTAS